MKKCKGLMIAELLILLALVSCGKASPEAPAESEDVPAPSLFETNLELTEEDGLDGILEHQSEAETPNITVWLKYPITRETIFDYLPVIADTAQNSYIGEEISLTVYLKEYEATTVSIHTNTVDNVSIIVHCCGSLGDKFDDFGKRIYDMVTKCADLKSQYSSVDLSMTYDESKIESTDFLFCTFPAAAKIGIIADSRDGKDDITMYNSWSELEKVFPNLNTYISSK